MDVTRYLNLFFLFTSFVAAIQLDDSVLESGRNGTDVVLLSVAYIEREVIFAEDNGLLRRIAYVETRDGFSSLTSGDRGGIWAVGEELFTNTQTSNDSDVVRRREQIKIVFDVDWEAVQWSELNKPFYSALAARLKKKKKKKKKKKMTMILKKVEMDNVKEEKMKEDKMIEDSVNEGDVEHIYETVRGFRNIQALYDPKQGIETMSPAAVDISMQWCTTEHSK